ncbi:hypothetical protein AVEN_270688-1 [Araneus ventricosus]|uniref:Uncharacterized protein n=1 Tax=Araneus ventricosus TaxID=182803 RepID=A0A4Y2FXZ9_ARAVE|nr:hypothetical protein AVEN_270688-1 [Araneus ventricosus]
MYDATVSNAFFSLIALEDYCFAVTSSSDKLSSATSCCETQCNSISSSVISSGCALPQAHQCSWLSISFLSTSSPLVLAKGTITLIIDSTGHIRQHFPTKAASKQK